jgi:murein DD-endopeptidase MepM/ murein hydrolase activator NlpD
MDTNLALPSGLRALVCCLAASLVTLALPTSGIAAEPFSTTRYATPIPPRDTPPTLLVRVDAVRAPSGEPRVLRVPIVVDEPVSLRVSVRGPGGTTHTRAVVTRAGGAVLTVPVARPVAYEHRFDARHSVPIVMRVEAFDADGERDALATALRVRAPRNYLPSTQMVSPLPGFAITSGFGQRWGRLHAGVDMPAPTGTVIHAARSGVVTSVEQDGGYGLATTIDHGAYSTFYAHQSATLVHVGQHVERGQAIGAVGTSGSTTGAHLHFEVHVGGVPRDPMGWLRGSR